MNLQFGRLVMKAQSLAVLGVVMAVAILFPLSALGQSATATVNGTVTDKSGGVVPGTLITITDTATGVVSRTQTNGSGHYAFLDVSPGEYTMTISKANYKKVVLPAFHLVVGQILTENATLVIGTQSETVTVNAADEGVMLESSSSELGNVIESKEIKNLPLNGLNFTQLLILSPGVTPVSTAQGSGISTTDAGISAIPGTSFYKPSFFGQQNRETFYLMDGIVNTDLRGATYGFLPIIDAMQEFRVQSHMDRAEYGLVTGGVINMLSKSGTSHFHGSVWEFDRNNMFDARDTFKDFCTPTTCGPNSTSSTPAAPGHYTQNEFGGAVGGPILARHHLYFYGAYQGWRYSKASLSTTLLPTAQELSGDFSNPAYSYYQHQFFNPYSTNCANGSCTVQPFMCDSAGNPITPNPDGTQTGGTPCLKIPQSMLSTTMQSYIKAYYLQPNALADESIGYNYLDSRPHIDNNNSYQVRIDFHPSDRNFGFARISQMWVNDTSPVTGTVESNVSNYHAYNFGGGYTHIFHGNLILNVNAGAMLKPYRFRQADAPQGYAPATSAGFTNVSQYGGMFINLSGPYDRSNAGNDGERERGNPVVNWTASLTWLKGNHTIKGGISYIYQNRLQRNLYQQFNFSDSTTSDINASKTGNSLASAILGLPVSFTAQTPSLSEVYFSMTNWAGYLQDSWRVSPKLTINYGLRYDYLPEIHMLDNRLANAIDIPNAKFLVQRQVGACGSTFSDPCIPGGIASVPYSDHIVFANGQEQSAGAITDNIGPRFGFAYQVRPHTVINGGVGVLYDTITARSQWAQNNIEGASWPWTTGISNKPVNISQNGEWPGATGNPLTKITDLEGHFPEPVVAPSPWLSAGYVNAPNYKDSRALEYNFQIQQQLAPTTLLSLAYAGSKNSRLDYTGYANAANHASPKGTPLTTIDSYKYIPWSSPAWHYSEDTGYANYNALLVSFQKRFSTGWNTIASYTWSKSMDNSSGWFGVENGDGGGSSVQNFFDPRNAYGPSGYDITNNFTWSTVYTFPFGRGQHWLQRGLLSYIAGGWTANYVFQAHSGQRYMLNVGGDPANISGDNGNIGGYSRPNVIGNPFQGSCGATPVGKRGPNGFCEYDSSAFAIPSGSFGNAPRMGYKQPYYNNLDFSLVKNTPLYKGAQLQFRAESFNTYNVMIPGGPGTTIGNSSAGLANGLQNSPRELQFGAKITF